LARSEVPTVQAILQRDIPFRIRLCTVVGIGSLSLLGAFIRRLPVPDRRLALLARLGRTDQEEQRSGQREPEPVHPTSPNCYRAADVEVPVMLNIHALALAAVAQGQKLRLHMHKSSRRSRDAEDLGPNDLVECAEGALVLR
jgi:hypothetical protein